MLLGIVLIDFNLFYFIQFTNLYIYINKFFSFF